MPRTFVIIDGSSLVHRAFYALPLLTTASGQYTNAVYGFTTMMVKLLDEIKPDRVAVAFDKGKKTFRNEAYEQYKAHRQATPGELSEQFAVVHEILRAFGIAILEAAGYEADDIIGTLAAKASADGCEVLIVTGDRDALQLIGPHTKVMLTKKGITELEVLDAEGLKNKYNVTPRQFIDLKGLMGDTSDNIPGVPGIGEKTAQKLLAQFNSIENLLAHVDEVPGQKLRQKLRENCELALLSKRLATIVCDVPLVYDDNAFVPRPNIEQIRELFAKLEFKSLLQKLGSMFPGQVDQSYRQPEESLPEPIAVTNSDEIAALLEHIQNAGTMVFYPIIIGQTPELVLEGLAIVRGEQAVYIPAGSKCWQQVLALFLDERISKITYDAKPMYNYLREQGQQLAGLSFDVLIAAYLLDPTASEYPLTALMASYLNKSVAWQEKSVKGQPAFAVWAAAAISQLQPELDRKLTETELAALYYQIELPLIDVLSAVETSGITVDRAHLQVMAEDIAGKVDALLAEIHQLAGEKFNVNSTKQLGVILFEKLELPVIKKTKTGYSTDAEVLEKLAGKHDIIDKLLEYRLLTKLKSTYLDGLETLIHKQTNRIHTSFNQTVTATGRLSSSEPNLQNIPIRTEIGRRIRELFVPGAGYDYIMSADYSQIELRILAHISQDDNLIEAFLHDQDVHTRTAAEVFGVAMDSVTPEMRARAKAVNFGIVYGISDYGLSRDIGVSRQEAAEYINSYFAKYRGVKKYIDDVIAAAHKQGYVTTLFGRRRYLPDINSRNFNQRSFAERTAMNTPIQGTAADVIKRAMIDVYKALTARALSSRILLQVHDELVLEVPECELSEVTVLVKEAMEQAVTMAVPLTAEVKVGRTWAEAK